MTGCSFPGCTARTIAKGLCQGHYARRRRGLDLAPLRPRRTEIAWRRLSPSERLDSALALAVLTEDGCRLWPTVENIQNYGVVTVDGKLLRAHRFVFELVNGPIASGLTVDHECHNRAAHDGRCDGGPSCLHRRCIEPSHLAAKLPVDNANASPHAYRGLALAPGRVKARARALA